MTDLYIFLKNVKLYIVSLISKLSVKMYSSSGQFFEKNMGGMIY